MVRLRAVATVFSATLLAVGLRLGLAQHLPIILVTRGVKISRKAEARLGRIPLGFSGIPESLLYLANTVREDKMTANAMQHLALVAVASRVRNVRQ